MAGERPDLWPKPDGLRRGQESVWDYPRPPRCELSSLLVRVCLGGFEIASTRRARRVVETSLAPSYYVPPRDVAERFLVASSRRSFCEWKGEAHYYDVSAGGQRAEGAVWVYGEPTSAFREIGGFFAFHPGLLECWLEGERVRAQAGGFYGGWVSSRVAGPFKGEAGSEGW